MITNVTKWGNSLAIRIPKPFADEIGIDQNSKVDIKIENNTIKVSKK